MSSWIIGSNVCPVCPLYNASGAPERRQSAQSCASWAYGLQVPQAILRRRISASLPVTDPNTVAGGGGFFQVYIAAYRLDCAHLPDCCFLAPRPRKIRSSNSPIRWLQLKAASTSRRPLPALPTPSTHLSPLSTPHHNLASSVPSHKAWGHTCHQFASA